METRDERKNGAVLQIVIVNARGGVTDEQMFASAEAIMPILRKSKAYIGREFRKIDDGRWLECIWWTSLEEGNQVGMEVHSNPEGRAMFELIEESFTLYNCLPGLVF